MLHKWSGALPSPWDWCFHQRGSQRLGRVALCIVCSLWLLGSTLWNGCATISSISPLRTSRLFAVFHGCEKAAINISVQDFMVNVSFHLCEINAHRCNCQRHVWFLSCPAVLWVSELRFTRFTFTPGTCGCDAASLLTSTGSFAVFWL